MILTPPCHQEVNMLVSLERNVSDFRHYMLDLRLIFADPFLKSSLDEKAYPEYVVPKSIAATNKYSSVNDAIADLIAHWAINLQ